PPLGVVSSRADDRPPLKETNREADRDRHFAVAAPLARRSICDDRTKPIWWHVGDTGQGADAERASTRVLSLQARNHRGDGGLGRTTVDRRSEEHLPRSHRGGTYQDDERSVPADQ